MAHRVWDVQSDAFVMRREISNGQPPAVKPIAADRLKNSPTMAPPVDHATLKRLGAAAGNAAVCSLLKAGTGFEGVIQRSKPNSGGGLSGTGEEASTSWKRGYESPAELFGNRPSIDGPRDGEVVASLLAGGWRLVSRAFGVDLDQMLADDLVLYNANAFGGPVKVPKEWILASPRWASHFENLAHLWTQHCLNLARERFESGERSRVEWVDSRDILPEVWSHNSAVPEKFPLPTTPGTDQFLGVNDAALTVRGACQWSESASDDPNAVSMLQVTLSDVRNSFFDIYDWHLNVNPLMYFLQSAGKLRPFNVTGGWDVPERTIDVPVPYAPFHEPFGEGIEGRPVGDEDKSQ